MTKLLATRSLLIVCWSFDVQVAAYTCTIRCACTKHSDLCVWTEQVYHAPLSGICFKVCYVFYTQFPL